MAGEVPIAKQPATQWSNKQLGNRLLPSCSRYLARYHLVAGNISRQWYVE